MRPFSIAGLQLELQRRDNIEQICGEILTTARVYPFVDMVLLPELCWFGADTSRAEALPGPTEERMCSVAREAGVWLVGGSLYERADGKIYNTCPIISPEGKIVTRYRKIYPFLPYEAGIANGDCCAVFDIPDVGRFGISICYDMWFPETIRQLTWMGAEVVLHPSLTNTIDRDSETAISRANATMHQSYFFDLNAAGMGMGQSGVYGPGGEVMHKAGSNREIIIVELDLDHVRRVRERGWHGLGQVMKSYRDANVRYPVYEQGTQASSSFEALGPMHFHKRDRG
ncbi:MAG TPA: carbon-nitrogen hydrolase family protein [Rhizomicrobium sp.]|jgi:predicted amidohydrolase|nr:carbon-nitrogen hydrolase family protein [Rhizomicrobium sp.]